MMKVVENRNGDEREVSALDRLAREGARRMLEQALEAEVESYVERHRDARGVDGRALVVRNGRSQARSVVVGAGVLDVRAPRVNDKRVVEGERQKFRAKSCRLTCVSRSRSRSCCPRCTCADCRRATSAARSRPWSATTLRASHRVW